MNVIMPSTEELKTCTKCEKAKPKTQFNARPSARDGLQYYCKSCQGGRPKNKRQPKPLVGIEHTCKKCGETKDLSLFPAYKDGRIRSCNTCRAAYTRAHYAKASGRTGA